MDLHWRQFANALIKRPLVSAALSAELYQESVELPDGGLARLPHR